MASLESYLKGVERGGPTSAQSFKRLPSSSVMSSGSSSCSMVGSSPASSSFRSAAAKPLTICLLIEDKNCSAQQLRSNLSQ